MEEDGGEEEVAGGKGREEEGGGGVSGEEGPAWWSVRSRATRPGPGLEWQRPRGATEGRAARADTTWDIPIRAILIIILGFRRTKVLQNRECCDAPSDLSAQQPRGARHHHLHPGAHPLQGHHGQQRAHHHPHHHVNHHPGPGIRSEPWQQEEDDQSSRLGH